MIIDTSAYTISPYGFLIVASYIVGLTVLSVILLKAQLPRNIVLFSIMMNSVASITLATIYTIVSSATSGNIAFGFSSIGAALGILISTFFMYKICPNINIVKAGVTILPLMYGISKLGCFFAGCCEGIKYDGLFSVLYKGSSAHIHDFRVFPIQLVENICFLGLFIIMLFLYNKISDSLFINGSLIIFCLVKFGLDFLRMSHVDQLISFNQAACLIICLSVTIVQLIKYIKKKKIADYK